MTDDKWEHLEQLTHVREVTRGEFFSQQGEIATEAGFLHSGHFKSVQLNRDGKEAILSLYLPGAWICDLESFLHGTTGRIALQAITDTVLICFDKQCEAMIHRELQDVVKYFLRIHQDYIVLLQHKLFIMQYGTARQKYEYFLAMNYGELIPHLKQRQIAAYLGITPEFLSVQKGLSKKV
jgi:CRP-like cAMP-binding protein